MVFHYFIRVPRTTSRDPYGKNITSRRSGPHILWYLCYSSRAIKSGLLLYCNIPDFMRGMIGINQLIYVIIGPNSESPYIRPTVTTPASLGPCLILARLVSLGAGTHTRGAPTGFPSRGGPKDTRRKRRCDTRRGRVTSTWPPSRWACPRA